jgi:hypothetical protein
MKGSMSILITFVLVALAVGLYVFLGKSKLDEKRNNLKAEVDAAKQTLQANEGKIAQIPALMDELPRWQRQFELFRTAIPVAIEDDLFLRNLTTQLNANGVRLVHMELIPAGQWFTNLNETQEEAFRKEHMRPEELRQVKQASYTVSLIGPFAGVLRAFENLKLYGRIYSIDTIISPAGGAGGAVFRNVDESQTPIQVSGKIFYGLSENYLSQETLNKFFGQAEALGAASMVSDTAMARSSQLSANPTGAPQRPDGGSVAPGAAPAPPATTPGAGAAPPAAPPAGTSTGASANKRRIAQAPKSTAAPRRSEVGNG